MSGESIVAVLGIIAGFCGVVLGAFLGRASVRESNAAAQRQALVDFEAARGREESEAIQAIVGLEAPWRYDLSNLQANADQLRTVARRIWIVGRTVDPKNWPESANGERCPSLCPAAEDLGWAGIAGLGGLQNSALTGVLSQCEIYRNHREAYLVDAGYYPALRNVAAKLETACREAYELLDEASNEKEIKIDRVLSDRMHRTLEMRKFDNKAYARARAALTRSHPDQVQRAASDEAVDD